MVRRKRFTFERFNLSLLNRQQHRDKGRRLEGNHPGSSIVHAHKRGIWRGQSESLCCRTS